jgi:hypothetical protein
MREHRDADAQEKHLRQRAEQDLRLGPAHLVEHDRANHMLGGWKVVYAALYKDYQVVLAKLQEERTERGR